MRLPTDNEPAVILEGDCLAVLPTLPAGAFDACVTDPPYGLVEPRSGGDGKGRPSGIAFSTRTEETRARRSGGFMGKAWDAATPGPAVWAEVLRVLKPGGYLLAMGGPRTVHRLTCAIEDAGFEIRDCLMWLYGSGFPKGKGCLKPAYEPIVLARKAGPKVLPLQIDECRVAGETKKTEYGRSALGLMNDDGWEPRPGAFESHAAGRWPANVLHDGSAEVLEAFAEYGERTSGRMRAGTRRAENGAGSVCYGTYGGNETEADTYGDSGTAARFFYCTKAARSERDKGMPRDGRKVIGVWGGEEDDLTEGKKSTIPRANHHPTVKPLELMRYLVRLVTPRGGLVLDPFAGSGTTLVAAVVEGRRGVGIEREAAYVGITRARLAEPLGVGSLFPPAAEDLDAAGPGAAGLFD